MDEDEASCVVCSEAILSKESCFLPCGHIYHSACITQWLSVGAQGCCPQCKRNAKKEQLRVLRFEVIHCSQELAEQVERMQALRARERQTLQKVFEKAHRKLCAKFCKGEQSQQLNSQLALDLKTKRKETERENSNEEAEAVKMEEELKKGRQACAGLRAEVGKKQEGKEVRKLRIAQSLPDDLDAREETKQFRLKKEERSRQLHEGYVSARELEAESSRSYRHRVSSIEGLTAERDLIKAEEAAIAEELAEVLSRSSKRALSVSAPATPQTPCPSESSKRSRSSLGTSPENQAPAADRIASPPVTSAASPAWVSNLSQGLKGSLLAKKGAPRPGPSLLGAARAEEDDFLYGCRKRKSSGMGILAKASQKVAVVREPLKPLVEDMSSRQPGYLRTLFASQQV